MSLRLINLPSLATILALTVVFAGSLPGGELNHQERGFAALDQALKDLTNPFTVMSVVARPGDEDAGTLVYHRKKLGARVVNLFLTRGEAGPDDEANEPSDEAGVARTRQMLAASSLEGADVYCLNLTDPGVCETADQVLASWGQQEALRRLVRAIRLIRPDAIVAPNEEETPDGRAKAASRLGSEAFLKAADADFKVDQVAPWQVRRLFQPSRERLGGVLINLGQYDRVRGQSYEELTRLALAEYSPGSAPSPKVSYHLIRATPAAGDLGRGDSLVDGLQLSENLARSLAPPRSGELSLIDAAAGRTNLIQALIDKLAEKRAEGTNEVLYERYGTEFFRVVRYIESLERALAIALGIDLEISASDPMIIPGQKFTARIKLKNWSKRVLPVVFHLPQSFPATDAALQRVAETQEVHPGTTLEKEVEYDAAGTPLTTPHRDHLRDAAYYPVGSTPPRLASESAFGYRLNVFAEVGLDALTLVVPAHTRVDVVPPVEMSVVPSFVLLKNRDQSRELDFTIRVTNHTQGPLDGALWVVPRALADDDYEPTHVSLLKEEDAINIRLRLALPILKPPLASDVLIDFRQVKPASRDPMVSTTIKVTAAEVGVSPGLNVGYLPAPASSLSQALTMLDVPREELSLQELRTAGLIRHQTLIIDEMVYQLQPDLGLLNGKLREYVEKGGNLVLLHQKSGGWNSGESRLAPFPITISNARICDERAAVKFLDPAHQLLSNPNRLTGKDFEGWVYDRAVPMPSEWSEEYSALLESGDPGQPAMKGGLLISRYGRGTFIYCAYTLGRQLKARNIGAYRVLANLVSLPVAGKQ